MSPVSGLVAVGARLRLPERLFDQLGPVWARLETKRRGFVGWHHVVTLDARNAGEIHWAQTGAQRLACIDPHAEWRIVLDDDGTELARLDRVRGWGNAGEARDGQAR